VLPRLVLLLCAGETASGGAPPRHSQATGGSQPVHGQEDGEARAEASLALLAAPEEVGAAADTEHRGSRHHDHRRQGCQGRRTATTVGAPAPVAAPAAPTHENKSGGQLPATSPTASAISFLPTVQQRGRVGHLQSPRHRTISWNGVYQEESPISHFGGPEAGQCTITPFFGKDWTCTRLPERKIQWRVCARGALAKSTLARLAGGLHER